MRVVPIRALRKQPREVALAFANALGLESDRLYSLLRLEQAVETIALETERIGEGQRYLTRLLADRADRDNARASDRPIRPGPVNTPH